MFDPPTTSPNMRHLNILINYRTMIIVEFRWLTREQSDEKNLHYSSTNASVRWFRVPLLPGDENAS